MTHPPIDPNTAKAHAAELELTVDRTLARGRAHSSRFVRLVVVAPSGDPTKQRPPVRIGFVIDRSGSMSGTPMECARQAVLAGMRLLGPDDEAAVVAFDTVVETPVPLTLVREGLPMAERTVPGISARGGTNLADGWLSACAQVGAPSVRTMNRRVILLTDGQANEGITDPRELARHANELRVRGLSTATLGLGEGFDERLLSDMAEAGGGPARFAATPQDIAKAIMECVGDAIETTVSAAEVTLRVPGAEFELLSAGVPAARIGELRVSLGDLAANQEREVVVRVRLPLGNDGEVVPLHATFTGTGQAGDLIMASAQSGWTFADHERNDQQARDRSVDRVVANLYAAAARQRAVQHNREHNFGAAQRELEAVARRIQGYATGDLELEALVSELQHEALDFGRDLGEMARKRSHYRSTSALAASAPDGSSRRRER